MLPNKNLELQWLLTEAFFAVLEQLSWLAMP